MATSLWNCDDSKSRGKLTLMMPDSIVLRLDFATLELCRYLTHLIYPDETPIVHGFDIMHSSSSGVDQLMGFMCRNDTLSLSYERISPATIQKTLRFICSEFELTSFNNSPLQYMSKILCCNNGNRLVTIQINGKKVQQRVTLNQLAAILENSPPPPRSVRYRVTYTKTGVNMFFIRNRMNTLVSAYWCKASPLLLIRNRRDYVRVLQDFLHMYAFHNLKTTQSYRIQFKWVSPQPQCYNNNDDSKTTTTAFLYHHPLFPMLSDEVPKIFQ